MYKFCFNLLFANSIISVAPESIYSNWLFFWLWVSSSCFFAYLKFLHFFFPHIGNCDSFIFDHLDFFFFGLLLKNVEGVWTGN